MKENLNSFFVSFVQILFFIFFEMNFNLRQFLLNIQNIRFISIISSYCCCCCCRWYARSNTNIHLPCKSIWSKMLVVDNFDSFIHTTNRFHKSIEIVSVFSNFLVYFCHLGLNEYEL